MDGNFQFDQGLVKAASVQPDPLGIVSRLQSILRADCSGLSLREGDGTRMLFMTCCDGAVTSLPLQAQGTYCHRVFSQGKALAVNHRSQNTGLHPCSFMVAESLEAYLGVPVFGFGPDAVGTLSLHCHTPRIWSAKDIALAHQFAGLVERALVLGARLDAQRKRERDAANLI